MRNIDILNLVNAGILAITANDLDASQAYKIIKFKRAVRKAMEAVGEAEKDLAKEAGIEDAKTFDTERAELRKSGEKPERLAELDKQFGRYDELRKALYAEKPSAMEDVKAMPYEDFHKLQQENGGMKPKVLNIFEDALEGVLWTAPEE